MQKINMIGETDVYLGVNILDEVSKIVKDYDLGKKVLVVTDMGIPRHLIQSVRHPFETNGFEVSEIDFAQGEKTKAWKNVEYLHEVLARNKMKRDDWLIIVGGGVIGDMAGFAASTWLRGINYVQVPTTLMAQIDSSIGGKTGINHYHGKNLIGTFYLPKFVLTDVSALNSLNARELAAGLAEAVKYGVIMDLDLFTKLCRDRMRDLVHHNHAVKAQYMMELVGRCIHNKVNVIKQDLNDQLGVRNTLNFGHTIGHAIEAMQRRKTFKYNHGECVSIGMVYEAHLAANLGLMDKEDAYLISNTLAELGLPVVYELSKHKKEEAIQYMSMDKKNQGDEHITFALPAGIARGTTNVEVGKAEIRKLFT
jgi:3-dehydroquinate synthase